MRGHPVVALLRGVNVGGRTLVPMSKLRSALEAAGFDGAGTILQSGNVLLPHSPVAPDRIAGEIESVIANELGLVVRVITRSAAEMTGVADGNPYLSDDVQPSRLHVVFLADEPDPGRAGGLDPDHSPPDRFMLSGAHIYVAYPGGSGRSKLSLAYFEKVLGVAGTARNWNTVIKLRDLTAG